jgi:poly-D-alanine transfer protein DltD
LNANELAVSTHLSYETKQFAARRLLRYPDTLKADPLLKFALEQLASDTLLSHVLYYFSYLLGKLQTSILELQDHYETVTLLRSLTTVGPDVPRQAALIDWNALKASARRKQIPHSDNNPYGFDNIIWEHIARALKAQPQLQADAAFRAAVDSSPEWGDLELVLKICNDLGAKPLLLGRPINAHFYHALGVSEASIQAYYTKLENLAKQYAVSVVDFRNLQGDVFFGMDPLSHTSREGWAYVDQELDAFYHQNAR